MALKALLVAHFPAHPPSQALVLRQHETCWNTMQRWVGLGRHLAPGTLCPECCIKKLPWQGLRPRFWQPRLKSVLGTLPELAVVLQCTSQLLRATGWH